jgi:hypothetical protein
MNIPTQIILGSVSLFQLAAAQVDTTPFGYTNFLRQFQLPGGTIEVTPQKSIFSSGKTPGVAFTDIGGRRYDLWTVKNTQGGLVETFLATTTVDLFKPTATITIRSGDPHNDPTDPRFLGETRPRRTRADQPFTVSMDIGGLDQDPTKSECFRVLNNSRTLQPYGTAKRQSVPYQIPATELPVRTLSQNRIYDFTYGTGLRGSDNSIKEACGEEVFEVSSLEDTNLTGQTMPVRVLDKKTIQVWPVSTGELANEYEGRGRPFQDPVPPIVFRAFNLYPRSLTYFTYYFGPYRPGAVGFDDKAIGFTYTGDISSPGREALLPGYTETETGAADGVLRKVLTFQTPVGPSTNFNSYLNRDGVWTIELRTSTPESFAGYTVLAYDNVTIGRTITLNTNLTTNN